MDWLKERVAIVTGGGGSGIGHGISLALAREGAHVVILDIDSGSAESVCNRIRGIGGTGSVITGDISRSDDIRRAMERVVEEHGRLDVLVNNAGIGLIRPVAETSEDETDRLAAVDFRGLWLCCKYAIPQMQRQNRGSIVNIASIHSHATLPLYGVYASMKAAVVGLTRGIAVQYGPDGIRANAVSPGLVDGQQTREVLAQFTTDVEDWIRDFGRRHQALPNPIQPEDVGNVVAFLASDGARAVTGAEIPVDAGVLAQLLSRDENHRN